MSNALWNPTTVGEIPLPHRLAMAPDVITVGTMALANPDLVERVRTGAPLNTPDPATIYGGNEAGYTDYPTLTA